MLLGGKTPFLTFKHHLGHIEVRAIANNWPTGQTVAHSCKAHQPVSTVNKEEMRGAF